MSYETTLIYTEPLVRQAVLAFWRRSIGIGYVIALVVSAFILGLLIAQGNTSWLIGSLATALAFGVLIAALLYVVHYRNSLRKFREMGSPHATLLVEESSFTIGSSIGTATLQWSAIKELWQFSGVWLLLYSRAQFSTLPLTDLSPEMQAFILQRVQAAGGKIVG
jgi:hypothetical protein